MNSPRFVPIGAVAAVVSLVLCAVLAWWVTSHADAETRQDCERAVAYREDGRAMWLYVVGLSNPDQTAEEQARLDAFVAELNERLPSLRCVDGNAVPVK